MSELLWSDDARRDVDDIYNYIARKNHRPLTADRFVRELDEACRKYAGIYAAGSEIGTPRDDLGDGLRVFTHKRWVVVFGPTSGGIEIIRVLDGSRDFPLLFQP